MAAISKEQAGHANIVAFLDMLAWSEIGPKLLAKSDDGYNVLVGGALFDSYADHPRKLVEVRNGLSSTAAGRYQILSRYWDYYKEMLNLPDFGPLSQDRYAIQQLKEQKATGLIEAGLFDYAVAECANIWASLPGAGYGQHEQKLEDLRDVYLKAGGSLSED